MAAVTIIYCSSLKLRHCTSDPWLRGPAGCMCCLEDAGRILNSGWAPPGREYIFVFIRARAAEPELHFKRRQLNGLEVGWKNAVSKSSWRRTIYMNQFTQTTPNVGLVGFFFSVFSLEIKFWWTSGGHDLSEGVHPVAECHKRPVCGGRVWGEGVENKAFL